MSRNRAQFLDETFELIEDSDLFDQDTGEFKEEDYYLKTVAVPVDDVSIIVNNIKENPELRAAADGIVDAMRDDGLTYSEIHAVLALAGAGSLPRTVIKEHPEAAPDLVRALVSVGMFHQIAADVVTENLVGRPEEVQSEIDEFVSGLEAAGFTEIAPGLWAGEQQR